jgi:hypothetical protein
VLEVEKLAMTVLTAIVKNGKIELEAPVDWPEGTEVRVEPVPVVPSSGIRDDDSSDSPEMIARDLALMDQIEAMEFTDEEQASWDAAREARRNWEKARFDEHAEAIRETWE